MCGFCLLCYSHSTATITTWRLGIAPSYTWLTHPAVGFGAKAPRVIFFLFRAGGIDGERGSRGPLNTRVAGGGTRRAHLTWTKVSGVLFERRAETGEGSVGKRPTFFFSLLKFGNVTHITSKRRGQKSLFFFFASFLCFVSSDLDVIST